MSGIANLPQFRQELKAILAAVEEEGTRIQRKVALTTLTAAVQATPVDTGRARGNWNASVDSVDRTTRDAPGAPGQGATDSINRGAAAIGGLDKFGAVINISNSLPYIERLNEGYSAQAPAGFVEKAAQQAVEAVRGEKVSLR